MQVKLFLDEYCMNSCELLVTETKTNFASHCFKEIAHNMTDLLSIDQSHDGQT